MQKYAAYIQAIRDDFCLKEVCVRLLEEGIDKIFFVIPDEYWTGAKATEANIQQVIDVANFIGHEKAAYQVQPVSVHRAEGRSRIMVETFFRNASIDWIYSQGYEHVIIADGDELWMRGYLWMINKMLVAYPHLTALGSRLVPTIGLPGYPIGDSVDSAVVYIRRGNTFNYCRAPHGYHLVMENRGLFHFSATRRTFQEIVDKHLDSGHGDDPDYDMRSWVQNVLPFIKPGQRNLHMFKHWQIWPVVRTWTADELNHIPASLYPYLAIHGGSRLFETLRQGPAHATALAGAHDPSSIA